MKPLVRPRHPDRRAQFPGEIAGASLKRFQCHLTLPLLPEFPGEIAGASLKRVVAHHRGDEALNSPAKSPGPH